MIAGSLVRISNVTKVMGKSTSIEEISRQFEMGASSAKQTRTMMTVNTKDARDEGLTADEGGST